ncbi:hypothetical protein AAG906_012292 [Vitis piasezkii]
MEASFAAQKKELEEEYQQQADEMYFFGYRCCMKKNGIMHDTPSFPSDEDDEPGPDWIHSMVRAMGFRLASVDDRIHFHFSELCLAVVVSCLLLIVNHPDGCGLSYLPLIQISS